MAFHGCFAILNARFVARMLGRMLKHFDPTPRRARDRDFPKKIRENCCDFSDGVLPNTSMWCIVGVQDGTQNKGKVGDGRSRLDERTRFG